MTAAELLDTLESRALLPREVLANLRQQVSRSLKVVTPESLARLLVGKGLITAFQAEQLLASAKPAAAEFDDEMSLAPLDDDKASKSTRAATPTPAKPATAAPAAAKPVVAKPLVAKPVVAAPVAAKPVAAKPVAAKPASIQPVQAAPAAKITAGAAATPPKLAPKAKPAAANATVAKLAPQADPFGLAAGPGPLDDLLGNPLSDNPLLGEPLLGDPLGNPLLGNSLLSEPAASAKVSPLRPASRRKKGIPTWVWFALSGVVILIGVVIAVVVLTRSNGDAEWRLAEKDYQAGQDQDATQKLNAFLEAFPRHQQASLARIYLGMVRLRQAFAAKTDWDGQLTAARQVLPELVAEPDFPQVRDTIAKMLPDMAAGLTQQAQAFRGPLDQRHEKAQQAREGLALAEDWRFVPDKLKPWASLQATSDQVAALSREIDRGLDVDKALTAVRAAVAAGNGADAYGVRGKLLQAYPELRQGSELDPVIQELVHAAPRLVKIDPQPRMAETKPSATPIVATFTDVPCTAFHDSSAGQKPIGLPVADPKSASIAVLASGAVYWLEANNGAPLGRQFVGLDSVAPVAIPPLKKASENAAGGVDSGATDWVVFDAVHKELVCFGNGGTELRWRQPLGDALDSAPLLLGRRLYLATRGGRLEMIDADSGKWLSAAQFPEPLRAAPGVSADGKTLYVAGDHGTLYFISASDLRCTAAAYLGYGSGSVRLPPAALGAYVVVVENPDWDGSALRIVSMPAADAAPRAVQKITLQGQVVSSPVVVGQQLMLATDNGGASAFDASGSGVIPLIKSMQTQPIAGSRQAWFIAVAGKQLWLAGSGLAHCDLGALAGAMRLAPDQLLGGRCQQSPVVAGSRIVVVYRRNEAPGVWVMALNAANELQWQAVLASPPVGEPMLDADGTAIRIVHPPAAAVVAFPIAAPRGDHVATVQLALQLDTVQLDAVQSDAVPLNNRDNNTEQNGESLNSPDLHCADAVLLPGGTLAAAFGDGSTGAARSPRLFFSIAKEPAFQASPWSDPVCSRPVALGRGLLIANPVGQLCLIDVATGQSLAAAFQPRLVPGKQLAWRKPAVVPDKPEAIVADAGTHLYRLGIDEKPSAHLVALAAATLARPVVSEVAIAGDLAFVVDDADNLTAVHVADLNPAKGWSLGASVAWGPRRVGDVVLVATVRELLAIDHRPEIIWRVPLDAGVPVGMPLQSGDDLLLATGDGVIERIDRKTGQLRAKVDLEQPLAAGPIVCGKNLAVVGQDGSVHIVAHP